jgi:hypothetical protein
MEPRERDMEPGKDPGAERGPRIFGGYLIYQDQRRTRFELFRFRKYTGYLVKRFRAFGASQKPLRAIKNMSGAFLKPPSISWKPQRCLRGGKRSQKKPR